MEVVDYDNMTDEEFMAAIDDGDIVEDATQSEEEEKEVVIEDTDQTDEAEGDPDTELETTEQGDGSEQETSEVDGEVSEEAGEENTQVEDNSKVEEKDDTEDNDAAVPDETIDSTDTDGEGDGSAPEKTDTVDYKAQYEAILKEKAKLQDFYDVATSEFTANGKKVKGVKDPAKLIAAQQMAAGYSEKMAGFKQYRPYMAPLKESGMLEDQGKFDMMMSIMNGDKEALKQHIKNLEIDPVMDLELDNINYKGESHLSSPLQITLDDVLENANTYGVKEKVEDVLLGGKWDKASVVELLNDPQSSADIVQHISGGEFEEVQDKIAELKRTDVMGTFSNQNSITQYRQAARLLSQELEREEAEANSKLESDRIAAVAAEKAKIEQERKDLEYKAKVEQKNKEAAEARAKASSVSKQKPTTKTKVKEEFDPAAMSDEEFTKLVDGFMYK